MESLKYYVATIYSRIFYNAFALVKNVNARVHLVYRLTHIWIATYISPKNSLNSERHGPVCLVAFLAMDNRVVLITDLGSFVTLEVSCRRAYKGTKASMLLYL